MITRPLFPPAHARAMSVLSSSLSGVGTYGGLKICTAGECLVRLEQNLLLSLCKSPIHHLTNLLDTWSCFLGPVLPAHRSYCMRCYTQFEEVLGKRPLKQCT